MSHDERILKLAFASALIICVVLFVWLMVLLVGNDEANVQDFLERQDTEQAVEQTTDTDTEVDDAEEDTPELVEDPSDDVDEDDSEETVQDDTDPVAAATNWIHQGGRIGFTVPTDHSVVASSDYDVVVNEPMGRFGYFFINVVNTSRMAAPGDEEAAYEAAKELQFEGAVINSTCRRTLIDGFSAECFSITKNNRAMTMYSLFLGDYTFFIYLSQPFDSATSLLETIDINPSPEFTQGAEYVR